ncbi:unnamed protein product, partial [Closterium sp. NIES-53]
LLCFASSLDWSCIGGAGATGPGGARTRGTGSARAGGVGGAGAGGAGAGDPGAGGAGAGGTGAGGTSVSGARARGVGAGDPGTGGAGDGGTGAGGTGAEGTRPGDPGAGGAGAGGTGAGGVGAGGTRAVDPGAGGAGAGGAASGGSGAGGTVQRRPFFVPPPPSSLPPPDLVLRQSVVSLSLILPRLFALFALVVVFLVRVLLLSPALRPSSVPLRVPLSPPPESSLPAVPDLEFDLARAASPTVPRLLATVVTDPSFESTAAFALVAELSDCPPSVGGECALGTDVLEDKQEDFECLATAAITGPYSSQWQTAMDAEIASWKSTGTYVDAVPPYEANIVDGMWIFRVKRPPGSPPVFKVRYVARGFSQRQGVDFFQTFSPTPLWVLLHVAAQRDYELRSLDFSTAFLQGSLHEEIWLRHPPGFTGSFPAGIQWSLRRPV